MRIIAGKYKNFLVPSSALNCRPSMTKLRESFFSSVYSWVLKKEKVISDINFLDLYAGTGIFTFEAISRGVRLATYIDNDDSCIRSAKNFVQKYGILDNINFLNCDISNLAKLSIKYDVIFIDPPYGKNLIHKTIDCLISNSSLSHEALIAIESEKNFELNLPNLCSNINQKFFGDTKLSFIEFNCYLH